MMGVSLLLAIGGVSTCPVWAANSVTVNIKGNLILNPPCEITGVGGGPVEVDFSDMVIRKITGTNYQQAVPYTLTCDAADNTRVALTFKGTGATFNAAALRTSNTNLGIRFASVSGGTPTFVALNTGAITFNNNQRLTINAYPVINGGIAVTNIAAGTFTSSATLEASYP